MTPGLISKFIKALNPANSARNWLHQRGGAILPMAIAGLLGTSVIAVPLLNRAVSGLEATKSASAAQGLNAEAAAWYAMWRLERDPTIHDEFTGTPPTTTFTFKGANITIIGVEPPDNSGIILSMAVTPNLALPDTDTTVTYTMTIKNDDDQAHDIVRVVADPAGSYDPTYLTGTTTGLTDVDPSTAGNRFTWTPVSTVTIAPFGAELTMSWDMEVDESEGNYWMDGSVRIDGVGDIDGLTEANVLVAQPNDIAITAVVNPVQAEAGVSETFSYQITMNNNGLVNQHVSQIKFWASKELDIVFGTSGGTFTEEPSRNSDTKSNDRWEWTWGPTGTKHLHAGDQLVQTFDMDAALPPGSWFVEAALKTEESDANGQEVAATSSSTAPIKAVRVYDINVDMLGTMLDIEALLDENGVEALSWTES